MSPCWLASVGSGSVSFQLKSMQAPCVVCVLNSPSVFCAVFVPKHSFGHNLWQSVKARVANVALLGFCSKIAELVKLSRLSGKLTRPDLPDCARRALNFDNPIEAPTLNGSFQFLSSFSPLANEAGDLWVFHIGATLRAMKCAAWRRRKSKKEKKRKRKKEA